MTFAGVYLLSIRCSTNMNMASLKLVLLCDNPATDISTTLTASGHQVVCQLDAPHTLAAQTAAHSPDMVIVCCDSTNADLIRQITHINTHHPRPTLVLATTPGHRSEIRTAIDAGVTAYITTPIDRVDLDSLLENTLAQFDVINTLRDELSHTRQQLEERKVIERAKGLITSRQNCNEQQAYESLRKLAMDRNLRLVDVARQVITVYEAPAA